MGKTKRIISFVLSLLLLVSVLPVGVSAADVMDSGNCGADLTWTLTSDGVLTIEGTGKMTDFYDSVGAAPWYTYALMIGEVRLPYGLTTIGVKAFSGCRSLKSITIPASVIMIESLALESCALTSIDIPTSVTSIDNWAFHGCSKLTAINVDDSNPAYKSEGGVLYNKAGTTLLVCPAGKSGTYTIPESVTSIGDEAFSGCSSLTSITIPEGVTSIGDEAFGFCSSLTSITIPSGVTSIGNYTFYDCSSLTSVTIPESVTSISYDAFRGCSALTSITIPSGVTSIGDEAFNGCSSLTSITIPEGVKSIGEYAFLGCDSLVTINVDGANPNYKSVDGVLYNKAGTLLILCPGGKSGSLTIPNGVYLINNYAFNGCSALTSITIPESVTSIGDEAFNGCSALTSITIPESVTSIGIYAFAGCYGLTDVYYGGTADQWKEISIGRKNDCLLNATKYYEGDQPQYSATLTDTGRSLSLSDLVFINQYCTIESESLTSAYICANGGLLVWPSQPKEASFANAQTNGYVQKGLVASGSEYTQRTNGIIAKNYGDTFFMCIYLKMPDGSYLYTPLKEYGVVTYCNNKIASATASQTLKAMCQTMQAYGAAAKAYFG